MILIVIVCMQKIFFKKELKDIDVNDIKKLRPDLRKTKTRFA